jgi:transposase InsO family protein
VRPGLRHIQQRPGSCSERAERPACPLRAASVNGAHPVGLDYWIRPGQPGGWDYRGVVISVVYLIVRRLLGCLMVLTRRHMSRDAELLVLHYNTARPHRSLGQLTPAQADSQPPLWGVS